MLNKILDGLGKLVGLIIGIPIALLVLAFLIAVTLTLLLGMFAFVVQVGMVIWEIFK